MNIKEIFLKKGWAGKTISRQETIVQMNPHIRRLSTILHAYGHLTSLSKTPVPAELAEHLRTLRADVGKLFETIASCGGIPDRSPDMDRAHAITSWENVVDEEQSFLDALAKETEIEHHMRTRAIIAKISENTTARQKVARQLF